MYACMYLSLLTAGVGLPDTKLLMTTSNIECTLHSLQS